MAMLPIESMAPLGLVALLVFAAALYGLAALGHFPAGTRQQAIARGAGPAILWGTMAIVALSIGVAIIAAWWLIPWYAAIIAAGIAILIAPLVLQYFSDAFVDGRGALLAFSGAAAVPAAALACYIGG